MNATLKDLMDKSIGMLSYNYGSAHPLTVAAKSHDAAAFLDAGKHFTEDRSVTVCRICDAIMATR